MDNSDAFFETGNELQIECIRLALDKGKAVMLDFTGFCMQPFLLPGDTLKMQKAAKEDLKIGDIIAFETEDPDSRIYVHRILRRFRNYVVTKGDTCFKSDRPVSYCKILGKIDGRKRHNVFSSFNTYSRFVGYTLCKSRLSWLYFALVASLRAPGLVPMKISRLLHSRN